MKKILLLISLSLLPLAVNAKPGRKPASGEDLIADGAKITRVCDHLIGMRNFLTIYEVTNDGKPAVEIHYYNQGSAWYDQMNRWFFQDIKSTEEALKSDYVYKSVGRAMAYKKAELSGLVKSMNCQSR